MFFKKKQPAAANHVDLSVCNPIIVNQTNHSVVIFMDRGILYNKCILQPGEAVGMTRQQTAGTVMPYKIHALVGDEKSLPTKRQSARNLISTAVIPAAFIVGTLAAASTAGTMTGPSTALSRMASGIVVRGMVIDSAALAAGSLTASRAAVIADKLIEKYPDNFATKSGACMPGNSFVLIHGGIDEPLTLEWISEKKFRKIPIQEELKAPMDTLQDKIEYYTPSMFRSVKSQDENDTKKLENTTTTTTTTTEGTNISSIEEKKEDQPSALESLPTPPTPSTPAPTAPTADQESEEDRQLRQAIEESLKLEETRKQQQAHYEEQLNEHNAKRKPVVLF